MTVPIGNPFIMIRLPLIPNEPAIKTLPSESALEPRANWPLFEPNPCKMTTRSRFTFLKPIMESFPLVGMPISFGNMGSMPCHQNNKMARDGLVSSCGDWPWMSLKKKDRLHSWDPMVKGLMPITIIITTTITRRDPTTVVVVEGERNSVEWHHPIETAKKSRQINKIIIISLMTGDEKKVKKRLLKDKWDEKVH